MPTITPHIDFDMEDLTCSEDTAAADDDPEETLSTPSPLTSDDESEDINGLGHKDLDDAKIPKPPGEAGRPCSGGYNLRDVLGWTKADFDKIQVIYT